MLSMRKLTLRLLTTLPELMAFCQIWRLVSWCFVNWKKRLSISDDADRMNAYWQRTDLGGLDEPGCVSRTPGKVWCDYEVMVISRIIGFTQFFRKKEKISKLPYLETVSHWIIVKCSYKNAGIGPTMLQCIQNMVRWISGSFFFAFVSQVWLITVTSNFQICSLISQEWPIKREKL